MKFQEVKKWRMFDKIFFLVFTYIFCTTKYFFNRFAAKDAYYTEKSIDV